LACLYVGQSLPTLLCFSAGEVAALGNLATRPELRRQGLATRTVARLCLSLVEAVRHVGLNVHADNTGAIALYEKLGFKVVAPYIEAMVSRKT
jgi:predicted GNAT family acetyltransferase